MFYVHTGSIFVMAEVRIILYETLCTALWVLYTHTLLSENASYTII